MVAVKGDPVTLADFVGICTKAGEASGGVSTSMLDDLKTCSVTVTQTYNFTYNDTYEDYYRKGKCPIVNVKKGSVPDIPCISLSADEHAIVLKNLRGASCALLSLNYSTGTVFDTSSITNMCSCKIVVPENGKELQPNHLFDIDVVRAPFYKNIVWGKTPDDKPDETGITSKTTADLSIRRNDGSYTKVTNVVTSLTVALDGEVYPKILAKRYQNLVYGISENLKTKLASKLALVKQPWFDGTGKNGEFLHRCADSYSSSSSGFNGDVNFETFMCIMGGGMKGTAINCSGLGDGTAEQFTTNFADVKGGTCVVAPSSTPGTCADGCPTTSGIRIGCLGDLGNETSGCSAGAYKVHAAWYNQMDAILDALNDYKYLEECPEKQILSSGGIGDRWNGYNSIVLTYSGRSSELYPILGDFEKKAGQGVPNKAYLGGCQAKTAVSGATKESNNAWGVGRGSYDMEIGGDGKQTGVFYLDFGYTPATPSPGAIDCCAPGVFGYLGRATIWLHVTGCSPSIKISLTPRDAVNTSKIPTGSISVTGKAYPSGTSASGTAISLAGGSSTLSFTSVKCRAYILIYMDATLTYTSSWNLDNQKQAPPGKYTITVEVN